jgi:GNAT superfamily N-acetyltransferase
MTGPGVSLAPADEQDLEELVSLRIEAMRESLERIGRFDMQRARQRFARGFVPELTRHIVVDGVRVGFVVVKPTLEGATLEHLYVRPAHQGRGIGARVLAIVCAEADQQGMLLRAGALRDSGSNRFYLRHGFVRVGEGDWDIYYVRQPAAQSHGSGEEP